MQAFLARLLTVAALILLCVPAAAQTCTGAYPGSCVFQDDGVPKEFPTLGENGGTAGSLKLVGSGTGYVLIQVPTGAITSYALTLPLSAGTNTYPLITDGSGSTSWSQLALGSAVTGQLPLANGGTNANLTASAGGIFYSTGSAGAILSGTSTAQQMLLSGANAAPAWSTATWPATTTINRILYSSVDNNVDEITTGNSGVLVTSAGGVPSISTTLPTGLAMQTPVSINLMNGTGLPNSSVVDAPAVNVLDYGAIAGNSASYTVNQTAFQTALATGRPVYCPDGQTFYTQAITIPINAYTLFGKCTLVAAGGFSLPAYAVLYATGNTGLTIRDVSVDTNFVAVPIYSALAGILTSSNTKLTIDGVSAIGGNAIFDSDSTGTTIKNSRVPNYNNVGIYVLGGHNIKVVYNEVTTTSAAYAYGIQVAVGSGTETSADVDVSHNYVHNIPHMGISISNNVTNAAQLVGAKVEANTVVDTKYEAINIQGVKNFNVTGNLALWDDGSSTDFGIDAYGNPTVGAVAENGSFVGNTVVSACKSGIGLDNSANSITVTGNTIVNANACNGSTTYHIAAILMYGGASHNGVFGNTIVDPNSYLSWQVSEISDPLGTSDYNTIGENAGPDGSLGRNNLGGTDPGGVAGTQSTQGEHCWFSIGTQVCSGNPLTKTLTVGQLYVTNSVAGLNYVNIANLNAANNAGAVLQTQSNAGTAGLTTYSTAAGAYSILTSSIPLTVGATGQTTFLGTSGTITISSAGTLAIHSGDLSLLGATSGYLLLNASSVAGANTATFPAATDTVVELTQTQTLTGKTIAFGSNTLTGVAPLASPTFSGTITGPDAGTWGSSGITATGLNANNSTNSITYVQNTNTNAGASAAAVTQVVSNAGAVFMAAFSTAAGGFSQLSSGLNGLFFIQSTGASGSILMQTAGTTALTLSNTQMATFASHILASSTTPTISACGTSPSVAGSDNFGTITAGSGTLTSCVMNFGHAFGTAPACTVSFGTAAVNPIISTSTTQLTVGATSLTSYKIFYTCGSTS